MDHTRTGVGDRHPVVLVCERSGGLINELGEPAMWSASDADVAAVIAAAEALIRKAQSVQTTAVAEATRRDLATSVAATGLTAWLSGLLTVKPAPAKRVSRLAEQLAAGVEATRQALAAGAIDVDQAEVIASAVGALPSEVGDGLRGKAECYLLEQAELHHAGVLAGLAAHLLDVVAPDLADAKLAEALEREERRDATRRNTFSATATHRGRMALRGELDPESWALVAAALEPLAAPASGVDADGVQVRDQRSVGQRHADALVEVCSRTLATETLPTSGGFPAHVAVTIDYDRLRETAGVGLLDTGAPIPAEDVRRVLCDAGVLPVVLDSTGVPLDVGRLRRVFSRELRRAVQVRDIGCALPGCTRPAAWCQVHHLAHWVNNGTTSLDNAVLLCGHHHRVIHRNQWTVRMGRSRRPEFIPPAYIDPDQHPRTNTTHLRT